MATKYGNYILNTLDKVGTWLAEGATFNLEDMAVRQTAGENIDPVKQYLVAKLVVLQHPELKTAALLPLYFTPGLGEAMMVAEGSANIANGVSDKNVKLTALGGVELTLPVVGRATSKLIKLKNAEKGAEEAFKVADNEANNAIKTYQSAVNDQFGPNYTYIGGDMRAAKIQQEMANVAEKQAEALDKVLTTENRVRKIGDNYVANSLLPEPLSARYSVGRNGGRTAEDALEMFNLMEKRRNQHHLTWGEWGRLIDLQEKNKYGSRTSSYSPYLEAVNDAKATRQGIVTKYLQQTNQQALLEYNTLTLEYQRLQELLKQNPRNIELLNRAEELRKGLSKYGEEVAKASDAYTKAASSAPWILTGTEVGALVPTMYVLSTDPNSYPWLRHSHKFGGKLSYLDYIK